MQWTLDRVLPRLVPLDRAGLTRIAPARRRRAQVQVLADAKLDPQLVEHRARLGGDSRHEDVGVDEREVTHEDRGALAEPAGLAAPSCSFVLVDERAVYRRLTAASVRPVHDVVVHERKAVEQLERGTGVDGHLIVGVSPGADERPVAERRPQPFAARTHQVAQRVESRAQ